MNSTPNDPQGKPMTRNSPTPTPIQKKWLLTLAVGAVAAVGVSKAVTARPDAAFTPTQVAAVSDIAPASGDRDGSTMAPVAGFAGKFLASHFAQSAYDWNTAADYLDQVIENDPDNFDLIKRAMVLAMGTGDTKDAAGYAQELLKLEPDNNFALLILAVDRLGDDKLDDAIATLQKMPEGDMTAFVKPLLLGWAEAGKGKLEIAGLAQAPMHLYHGALMALFVNNKAEARRLTDQILQVKGLTEGEVTRVADLLAALGDKDKALGLYQGLRLQGVGDAGTDAKIAALESGDEKALKDLLPPLGITSIQQGAALALYDMGFILYQEESDSSTKLFVQMALAIDPDLTDGRLLLAETMIRNDRTDEAIALLKGVPETHPAYMESQRQAAELLAREGRSADALALLDNLYATHKDVESLIRMGDILRYDEKFGDALKAYNRAAQAIGGDRIPEEYWHLLYARGMVYERMGEWNKAVADLQAAVTYRPNHPYLLNYLGYGWADKGENLDQSLEMIRKASALRPTDGFITDSLGWVLYRQGKYEEAVPHLERAVELQPYDATINEHLGDAYWRVGRKVEARFQWRRAINNSEDQTTVPAVMAKLKDGLPPAQPVRAAATDKAGAAVDKVAQ
jgi:tetratricopeptide (TPR) repeat protein